MKKILQLATLASLLLVTSASAVEFTYIGTNNDDFAPFLETALPILIEVAAIPAAPEGSNLYQNGTIQVAQFADADLSVLSTFGRSKVTITQTTQLAGYILKARYFKQDATNSAGFVASGPVLEIDGDELVIADVTAQAETGMRVNEQTGFQLRVWKEAKTTGGGDTGGTDNADAAAAVVTPVLNISIVGTNAELSWDDTHPFDVHYSNDLSAWINTNINSSPHSRALSTSEFFKLIESESETIVDTDQDGVADEYDAFPTDPNESVDADNDELGDNGDNFINSPGADNSNSFSTSESLTGDIGGMILTGATLMNPTFVDVTNWGDLTNARIEYATAQQSNFSLGNMSGITLKNSDFSDANFSGADLSGAAISSFTILNGANFSGTDLSDATISGDVEISNLDLSGADLTDASFWNYNYNNTNLSGIVGFDPIIFTFIGTNNHDFSTKLEGGVLHAGVVSQTMPIQEAGSDLSYNDSIPVIEWSGSVPLGGSQFGRSKVTIAQTSALENFNLKVRFFIEDGNSVVGFAAAGPVITIDGAELVNGDVTAEADIGHTVSTRTGYSVRVWKEHKPEPEMGDTITGNPLFLDGPNDTWAKVLALTTLGDGASSQSPQSFRMNVISLPDPGAKYRVYKTTANGNDYFGSAQALTFGVNTITVAGVNFNRAVKIQFSSGDVIFDHLDINGEQVYPE